MPDFEIEFDYVGKGKKPAYIHTEYGFGFNPPLIVHGKNQKNVVRSLHLPKTVKVRSIMALRACRKGTVRKMETGSCQERG